MITTTLYKIIQGELQKQGLNEFVNEQGELVYFEKEHQFIQKIIRYDSDVEKIVNDLFLHLSLENPEFDYHFKKTFTLKFLNRQINFQTVENFQTQLMTTFLTHQHFMNQVYQNFDQFATSATRSTQQNNQLTDGSTVTDTRNAHADLPQNQVNIDVNDSVLESANTNTISKNQQQNKQTTDGTTSGETQNFNIDQFFQASQLLENVLKIFDKKCFLQIF